MTSCEACTKLNNNTPALEEQRVGIPKQTATSVGNLETPFIKDESSASQKVKPMEVAKLMGFGKGVPVQRKDGSKPRGTIKGFNGGSTKSPNVIVECPNGNRYTSSIGLLEILTETTLVSPTREKFICESCTLDSPSTEEQQQQQQIGTKSQDLQEAVAATLAVGPAKCILPLLTPTISQQRTPEDSLLATGGEDQDRGNSPRETDMFEELLKVFNKFHIQPGTRIERTVAGISISKEQPSDLSNSASLVNSALGCSSSVNLSFQVTPQ